MLAFRETEEPFVQTRRKRGVMSKEGERIGVSPYRSREVRRLHSAHLMSISLDATRTKDLKKPIVIRKNTYFQEGLVRWFYLVGARLPYTYGRNVLGVDTVVHGRFQFVCAAFRRTATQIELPGRKARKGSIVVESAARPRAAGRAP